MFFAPSKSSQRAKIWHMGVPNTSDHIQSNIRMPNPSQEPPAPHQSPKLRLKGHGCSLYLKNQDRAKIWIMNVSKTSYHIQINIKMQNSSQEPPASSKTPNKDLKDMDVICTFKITIESQNSKHGCTKDLCPNQNQYEDPKPQSGTSSVLHSPN